MRGARSPRTASEDARSVALGAQGAKLAGRCRIAVLALGLLLPALAAAHEEPIGFLDASAIPGGHQGIGDVVRTFTLQGIHHIFIGPDHILFIVGLLLLGGSLRRLLEIVTAFTLAHSVTLALATFRLVDPPPRVVEPLIALSIVYVGIETLLAIDRRRDWRRTLAFGFGFVHGFGFAGVLRELGLPESALGWSLAAFNVGVELGQAAIVLAVAPTLALLGAWRPAAGRRLVTAGSFGMIAAGGYWFVQRVFFVA